MLLIQARHKLYASDSGIVAPRSRTVADASDTMKNAHMTSPPGPTPLPSNRAKMTPCFLGSADARTARDHSDSSGSEERGKAAGESCYSGESKSCSGTPHSSRVRPRTGVAAVFILNDSWIIDLWGSFSGSWMVANQGSGTGGSGPEASADWIRRPCRKWWSYDGAPYCQ